uniref:ATP synthase complex subunit 8 n=1 Tax=Cerambycidae sp. 5 KM-2017 TaxID=2219290 RepID=A0A346RK57_9CUCU|nr:ATP synthase F0 subunit 8 [Cerambycidae sp. 5 KM-2017]
MPQMAPLNWLILFIFFLSIFLLFNIINYFNINMTPEKKYILKSKTLTNWKW